MSGFMYQYAQKSCPICQTKFQEGNDVVVCPECGTREALESIGLPEREIEDIVAVLHTVNQTENN